MNSIHVNAFRRKRAAHLVRLIEAALRSTEIVRILDVGGRATYWHNLPEAVRIHVDVTIANLAFDIEREGAREVPAGLRVRYVEADARRLTGYGDHSFDIVHSNSVIEHVGLLGDMAAMAAEVRRVGHAYFVQTPNVWFPLEPHFKVPFFHWLPKTTRVWLLHQYRIGRYLRKDLPVAIDKIDHIEMIDGYMMRQLFPDARIERERVALLTKSFVAVRDRPADAGGAPRSALRPGWPRRACSWGTGPRRSPWRAC